METEYELVEHLQAIEGLQDRLICKKYDAEGEIKLEPPRLYKVNEKLAIAQAAQYVLRNKLDLVRNLKSLNLAIEQGEEI